MYDSYIEYFFSVIIQWHIHVQQWHIHVQQISLSLNVVGNIKSSIFIGICDH